MRRCVGGSALSERPSYYLCRNNDLFFCCFIAQAKTDALRGALLRISECFDHVRGFRRAGAAGGAGGCGKAHAIESRKQILCRVTGKIYVQNMWRFRSPHRSVDLRLGSDMPHAIKKIIPQRHDASGCFSTDGGGDLRRHGKAHDTRHILGAGTHAELLAAARARKVIEKLREKQFQRWRAQQERKDAALMDEIATQLDLRNSAAGSLAFEESGTHL